MPWQAIAEPEWGTTASWIQGRGQYAVLHPCASELTVTLCATPEEAKTAKTCRRWSLYPVTAHDHRSPQGVRSGDGGITAALGFLQFPDLKRTSYPAGSTTEAYRSRRCRYVPPRYRLSFSHITASKSDRPDLILWPLYRRGMDRRSFLLTSLAGALAAPFATEG